MYKTVVQLFRAFLIAAAWFAAQLAVAQPSNEQTAASDAFARSANESIRMTDAQARWIQARGKIRIAIDRQGWPPFDVVTTTGQYRGYSGDLFFLLCARMNVRCEPVIYETFEQSLAAVQNGEADVIGSFEYSPERAKTLSITRSYFYAPVWVITPANKTYTRSQGNQLTWVVERGYATEAKLRALFPNAKLVLVTSTEEALAVIANGKADAYPSQLVTASFWIDKLAITNVTMHPSNDFSPTELGFASSIANSVVSDLFDAAITTLTNEDKQSPWRRWIAQSTEQKIRESPLALTERERAWLSSAPVVRVAYDPSFFPFTRLNDSGKVEGLAADYLERMAKQLDLRLEFLPTRSFDEAYKAVVEKRADLLMAVAQTPARQRVLNFVGPYNSQPTALAVSATAGYVDSLASMNGKRLALPKSHFLREHITREAPKAVVVDCSLPKDCLELVRDGAVDATAGNLAVLGRTVQNEYPGELRIGAALTSYPSELFIGVRNDWLELSAVLDRAIDAVPEEDSIDLRNKWLAVNVAQGVQWDTLLKFLVPILAALIGVLIAVSVWNRKLAAEVEKRRAAELAATDASSAKARFLATISHEIRTPMNGVIGVLDLLKHSKLASDQQGLVTVAHESAHSLLALLNDVLDFSKIEANKLTFNPAPAQILRVIETAAVLFAPVAAEKGIDIVVTTDKRDEGLYLFDEFRLQQVINNLVSNALKFSNRGRVEIRLSYGLAQQKSQPIRISVIDQGVGITPEQMKRLFQAFEQGIERPQGGTGLGLSICKRIVEIMGGTIEAESERGLGTSFHIDLAFARAGEPARLTLNRSWCIVVSEAVRPLVIQALQAAGQSVTLVDRDNLKTEADWKKLFSETACVVEFEFVASVVSTSQLKALALNGMGCICVVSPHSEEAQTVIDWSLGVARAPWLPSALFAAIDALSDQVAVPALPQQSNPQQFLRTSELPIDRTIATETGALVLLVDDHPTNRMLQARQLSEIGFVVDTASDGDEALEMIRERAYAAVITDLRMPRMSGDELAKRVRTEVALANRAQMPMLLVSAESASQLPHETTQWFSVVLQKPVELASLRQALARQIEAASERILTRTQRVQALTDQNLHPILAQRQADQAAAPSSAVVDWRWLQTNYGAREDCIELLKSYGTQFDADVAEVCQAIESGSAEGLVAAAHTLKGAVRSIGASALAEAAQTFELNARLKRLPNDLERINFDALVNELKSFLDSPADFYK